MIVLRPCAVRYKFQLCTGFTRPFWPVRCRPAEGARRLPKTDSRGRTPCSGRPLRRPHLGPFFLRAEVHSRRCRYSEFVAAKRHFESEAACELRSANCGAVRPIHRIVDNVAISLYNINTYSYSMRLAEKGDFIDEF